jgi:hypothetical protein
MAPDVSYNVGEDKELAMSKAGYQIRIKQRIAELRDVIAAAELELRELEVAERVIERLGGGGSAGDQDKAQVVGHRPSGTSGGETVANRAIAMLRQDGPMSSSDLLRRLQQTWRADLAQTTLSSTLSRASKQGHVSNEGGFWRTPDKGWDIDVNLDDLLDLNSATGEDTANDTPAADVFE